MPKGFSIPIFQQQQYWILTKIVSNKYLDDHCAAKITYYADQSKLSEIQVVFKLKSVQKQIKERVVCFSFVFFLVF